MLKFKNYNLFKKLHKNQKGMSLVELIIAVTILSVAIAPLLYSFAHSARYNAKAKKAQRATTAAQTVMENIKAYNLDSLYEKFCVDPSDTTKHIDTVPFLYNNSTAVYSTTNTYNANAGYADKMGTYTITGMKMSDGPSDSHLYDVDITIAPDKTESLPTYHVYNPSLDALYEENSESEGMYAFDPYFVATTCVKNSGVPSESVKCIEINRSATLVFDDTTMRVDYAYDYYLYSTPEPNGAAVLGNGTFNKSTSVDRGDSATRLRDVYYYYYPAFRNRLGSTNAEGDIIDPGIIRVSKDKLYIRNKTTDHSTEPVNVYVFKQRDMGLLSDPSAANVIRACEPTYRLEIHADNGTVGLTNVYDCVQKSVVNPEVNMSSMLSSGLSFDSDLVKDRVTVKTDITESRTDLLTYSVEIKVYDPATDSGHTSPLSTMSGTVVY